MSRGEGDDRRLLLPGEVDDSSWTDADSMHSNPRLSNTQQLKSMVHELEVIRANVQMMLDRVLSVLQQPPFPAPLAEDSGEN